MRHVLDFRMRYLWVENRQASRAAELLAIPIPDLKDIEITARGYTHTGDLILGCQTCAEYG